MYKISNSNIEKLEPNEIFVFGSNKHGFHCGGAARIALDKFGAIYGQSKGLQGQSYGINTMSGFEIIKSEIEEFIVFAKNNPKIDFLVTELACGIAGYTHIQIAPLLQEAVSLENVFLPLSFVEFLKDK